MKVRNVSKGIRYGWTAPNAKREALVEERAKIDALPTANLSELVTKRAELERIDRELGAMTPRLVPVLPDEVAEVPPHAVERFLAHLTDDWEPVEPKAWPPGTKVRATVPEHLRPGARRAQGLIDIKESLIELDPKGKRAGTRAA